MIDTGYFKPIKIEPSDCFNILHVGRFERAKGVETLVEAFIQLAKKYSNIYLTFIGNARGPSLEICKRKLSKENLNKRVTFKGFITYAELPVHYNKCDIVVVPSEIYESFSYTVAQNGLWKTSYCFKIRGIPETVNNGKAGILFQPGNFEDLIEKIELLYLHDDNRISIGKKAREHVVNNFSIEVLGPTYIKYYQSLTS